MKRFHPIHWIQITILSLMMGGHAPYSTAAPIATWSSPPSSLSQSGRNTSVSTVSVSSDGTKATAIWVLLNGSNNNIIQTASATILNGVPTWGGVTDLTAAGQNANEPQISVSSDGTKATAIWWRSNGSNNIIQTASATISGNTQTWGG